MLSINYFLGWCKLLAQQAPVVGSCRRVLRQDPTTPHRLCQHRGGAFVTHITCAITLYARLTSACPGKSLFWTQIIGLLLHQPSITAYPYICPSPHSHPPLLHPTHIYILASAPRRSLFRATRALPDPPRRRVLP